MADQPAKSHDPDSIMIQQRVTHTCRFYEEEYPQIDEVVLAKVTEIEELGAYAHLMEYDNKQGMILMSELSRRRIRSVNKLVRIGKEECVVVLRADQEKGYIDLSKRRATQEDHAAARNRYEKAKAVHSIVTFTFKQLKAKSDAPEGTKEEEKAKLESLFKRAVWHFDSKYKTPNETHKASYTYFKKAVEDSSVLDECDLTSDEKNEIMRNIRNKMTPTADKVRADIKVQCTGPDGIDAIKTALRHGINKSTEFATSQGLVKVVEDENNNPKNGPVLNKVSITLINSPEYVVTLHTLDKEKGLQIVETALKSIKSKIEEFTHGDYKETMPARLVGVEDDAKLQSEMEAALEWNREVPADSDDEVE